MTAAFLAAASNQQLTTEPLTTCINFKDTNSNKLKHYSDTTKNNYFNQNVDKKLKKRNTANLYYCLKVVPRCASGSFSHLLQINGINALKFHFHIVAFFSSSSFAKKEIDKIM